MTCGSCSRPPRRRGCERRHPQGVGLTDFAQGELEKIVFVRLPPVEQALTAGQSMSEVESEERVQEIYAPAAGTVTAVRGELDQNPGTINEDCYEGGWIVEIDVTDAGAVDNSSPRRSIRNSRSRPDGGPNSRRGHGARPQSVRSCPAFTDLTRPAARQSAESWSATDGLPVVQAARARGAADTAGRIGSAA
ncbi:glycine cleavage system protein H [Streptomyces sp. NPDC055794]